MADVRAHLIIRGLVQGVGYRFSAIHQARRLGITGWARNTYDGSVETVLEGDDAAVKQMIDWCREGPSSAVVNDVDAEWETYTGEFENFDIRF